MMPYTYPTDAADSKAFRMRQGERRTEVFYGYRFPTDAELGEVVAEQEGVAAVAVTDVTGPESAGHDGFRFVVYFRITEV